MKTTYGFLLLATGLLGCSPRVALPTGNYQETGGPGVILLSSKQLRLLSGHQFEYFVHSDDISSGKYGTGSYQQRGQQLRLTFDGQPLGHDTAWAQARTLASKPQDPDSLTLTFQVWSVAGRDAPTPYSYATVASYDASGQLIAGTACDLAGRAKLRVARRSAPVRLLAAAVGSSPWQQACPDHSTAYEVYLTATLGSRYAAGAVREFQVLGQTADRLELRDGAGIIVLKRENLVGQTR